MTRPNLGENVQAISVWMDTSESYKGLDPEAHMWRRCMKITEEAGEVFEALAGALGENPRKGKTHEMTDVVEELLDVALAALAAVEHLTGNVALSEVMLLNKAKRVRERAGV